MKQHPTYAYELLKTINYLRPALDIPTIITKDAMDPGILRAWPELQFPLLHGCLPLLMNGTLLRQVDPTAQHGLPTKLKSTSAPFQAHTLIHMLWMYFLK